MIDPEIKAKIKALRNSLVRQLEHQDMEGQEIAIALVEALAWTITRDLVRPSTIKTVAEELKMITILECLVLLSEKGTGIDRDDLGRTDTVVFKV